MLQDVSTGGEIDTVWKAHHRWLYSLLLRPAGSMVAFADRRTVTSASQSKKTRMAGKGRGYGAVGI